MWFAALLLATAARADALQLRQPGPSHSPVTKVILLITRIQKQIETEGAVEAKAYDKFACFCKEQADGKQYAIEKAQEEESRLSARIEEAQAQKDELDANVAQLNSEVDDINTEITEANSTRTTGHDAYVARDENLKKGVEGIEKALASTVGDLKKRESSLAQVRATEHRILSPYVALLQKGEPGYSYDYQSMGVVETVETLKEHFRDAIKKADEEELKTQQEYEMVQGGRENLKTAKLHSASKQNATSSELGVEIADKNQTLADTEASRSADQAFLQDLTTKCERKAEAWDARSTVRSGELQAIAKALEILQTAQGTYGATDDLGRKIGVHLLAKGRGHVRRARATRAAPPAFVQTRAAVVRRAFVKSAQQGGMDEVKGMIQDLIAALEQEGRDAEAQAQWCETEMGKATEGRDASIQKLEELNATQDTEASNRDALAVEIAGLSADIAQLQKALNEETELRTQESAVNAKKLADATTGEEAVDNAIEVLETYYQGVAVADGEGAGPDDSDLTSTDSSGGSVNDAAPETISNDQYGGSQDAAGHVVSELQKIKQDFADAISGANDDEQQAASDYDDFKSDTEGDIGAKTTLKEQKEDDKVDAELNLKQALDDEKTTRTLLAQQEREIEKLKPACSASGSTAADRAAQRQMEMNALNEGLSVMDSTDFGSPEE
jgi:hypothetical protein